MKLSDFKLVDYEELKKIKNPVLLYTKHKYGKFDRLRILFPDGNCEYLWLDSFLDKFLVCCFQGKNLKETVGKMKQYDNRIDDKCVGVVNNEVYFLEEIK